MRRIFLYAPILVGLAASPARALDSSQLVQAAPSHGTLVQGGGFGFASGDYLAERGYSLPLSGPGGVLGLGTHIDASLRPNLGGGYSAGIGASMGPVPGQLGATYEVRLGAGWAGEHFTVNPMSRLGLAEAPQLPGDVNLSFTFSQPITSRLSVTGAAEAHRSVGANVAEPLSTTNEVVVGAGIGLRF